MKAIGKTLVFTNPLLYIIGFGYVIGRFFSVAVEEAKQFEKEL